VKSPKSATVLIQSLPQLNHDTLNILSVFRRKGLRKEVFYKIFVPLNCSVPVMPYVPPVKVVHEKLVRLPFTSNLLVLLPTVSVPLFVKIPAFVKRLCGHAVLCNGI
jgi:hypothetical protein